MKNTLNEIPNNMDNVAKVENEGEKEVNYMIKEDKIHTYKIPLWNDFILVGDSLIAW